MVQIPYCLALGLQDIFDTGSSSSSFPSFACVFLSPAYLPEQLDPQTSNYKNNATQDAIGMPRKQMGCKLFGIGSGEGARSKTTWRAWRNISYCCLFVCPSAPKLDPSSISSPPSSVTFFPLPNSTLDAAGNTAQDATRTSKISKRNAEELRWSTTCSALALKGRPLFIHVRCMAPLQKWDTGHGPASNLHC